MSEVVKNISYFMSLPYTMILRRDDEGDLVARIEELPGCIAHGEDESEAIQNLKEMQRLWLTDCIESCQAVPEPEKEEPLPSGKWVQRVPRSLHQKLAQMAKRDDVSLNQLVTSMLSEAVSANCVEKVFEGFLARCVASTFACETTDQYQFDSWHHPLLPGEPQAIEETFWSMRPSSADPAALLNVAQMMPKRFRVSHAIKGNKEGER